MQSLAASMFLASAGPARQQDGKLYTYTLGKMARVIARQCGTKPNLRRARELKKEWECEGVWKTEPCGSSTGRKGEWNHPFNIRFTGKGLTAIGIQESVEKPAASNPSEDRLKTFLEMGYPKDTPREDPTLLDFNRLDTTILKVLIGIAAHFKTTAPFPSQETIVEQCRNWYHLKTSVRNVNRRLNFLEAAGMFTRIQRNGKNQYQAWVADGKKRGTTNIWRSTIYVLQKKVWIWAKKISTWARKLAAFTGLPIMAVYTSKNSRMISGGSTPQPAKPPLEDIKGAASPTVLFKPRGHEGLKSL